MKMKAKRDAKKTANMAAISSESNASPAQNFFTLLVNCLNIIQCKYCMEKSFQIEKKTFLKFY
jgi:hypothetical protein